MRTMILISGALALGLAACGQGGGEAKTETAEGGAPSAAEMQNGPKPGLWRVTTEMSGMPAGAPAMAPIETCIQTASFEAPAGAQSPGADCTTQPFTRDGDAMVSSSSCTIQGGMKADSTIRVTGDFNSRYVMTVNTKMDPAPAPNMAETTITMTGERLGDCPAA